MAEQGPPDNGGQVPPDDQNFNMEDAELQHALMMSMQAASQGAQPEQPPQQGQGSAPVAAATTANARPPPAAAPPVHHNVQAAQLQQALAQALGMPPPQQQQALPPQPPRAQRTSSHTATAQRMPSPPAWLLASSTWPHSSTPVQKCPVPKNQQQPNSTLASIFSTSLGIPITPVLEGGSSGDDQVGELTLNWVAGAVRRVPAGENTVLTMQQCWVRAIEAAQKQGDASLEGAVAMLQKELGRRATVSLMSEEDDLFFEGGKDRQNFLLAMGDGRILPGFLDSMASCASTKEDGDFWKTILRDAFKAIGELKLERTENHEVALRRLDILTQSPALRQCLAAEMVREAGTRTPKGVAFEAGSILAPLIAFSALPRLGQRSILPLEFPAKGCFAQLRNYPRNRGSQIESEIGSIRRVLQRIYTASHEICKRVATVKPVDPQGARGKEVIPAWFAAVAACNLPRADAGSYLERVLSHKGAIFDASSDAFVVGSLAVALRFCRPFMATAEKKQGALVNLDASFYRKQAHRMVGIAKETTLAGSTPNAAKDPPRKVYPAVSPDRADTDVPHFVAEIFFATQRLLHVSLVPAIHRSRALQRLLQRRRTANDGNGGGEEGDGDEPPAESTLEEWLLADSTRAVLADPEFGNDVIQFCELTARWLLSLLQQKQYNKPMVSEAMGLIPDSVVRDLCTVLSFLIHQRATDLFGGADIAAIISCLTTILRSPELIPSPAVHYSVIQLLLAMLSPQLAGASAAAALRRPRPVSPAEAALVSAVLGTGAAQTELLPAIMSAYVHADHVVGLDVDREAYDKFHLRSCCNLLLMELWRDPTCAASLDVVAGGGALKGASGSGSGSGSKGAVSAAAAASDDKDRELFSDFCGACVNDLVYLLRDSMGRLEDISTLKAAMADSERWAAQPPAERAEQRKFYVSQQRTATGFMAQALTTLKMLNTLVASRAVQAGFATADVAPRAAGAAFHFVDVLVRRWCTGSYRVENPERYNFDPDQLLVSMLSFMLRLAEQPAFVSALSEVPDFDPQLLLSAAQLLSEKGLGEYEHRTRLQALAEAMKRKQGGGGGAVLVSDDGVAPMVTTATTATVAEMVCPSAEELDAAYISALSSMAVGEFDATLPRAYNRHFASMAETAAGDVSAAAKRLSRELRDLSGKMSLPVHADGAILVRHDGTRLDKMRACITGPEGTPYAGGMFFFDVFFPPQYPSVPPLLELETTGGGVARFNPNLYADGKVCLSLLGTWHGGDESEKWNPKTSTLWQVLLSIQGMILVPQPYFNEPAYEAMRGTQEGDAASSKYTAELWLATVRYAMIDVLKSPRPGFEEAILAHFRTLRPRILRQVAEWTQKTAEMGDVVHGRLEKAGAELHALLAAL